MSQHLEFGGPFDVAEHGDALRAPGGTVDVTAIGAGGGDGGADETLLWKKINKRKINNWTTNDTETFN